MEKLTSYKTSIELHKEGCRILAEQLGVVNFIRFIQDFERGEGDYTKDRRVWQSRYRVEDIIKEIKKT
ncbi:hypothetical protein JCM13304A_10310 [Desulfothermus okinawensis JCM 13304]